MATLTPNRDPEVTIVQQGTLKARLNDLAFAGTGQRFSNVQVPVGKKWLLKAYQITWYGTYTAADAYLRLKDSSDTDIFSLLTLTPGTNVITQVGEQQLQLDAGTKIGVQTNITADTNGHLQFTPLYVEFDA